MYRFTLLSLVFSLLIACSPSEPNVQANIEERSHQRMVFILDSIAQNAVPSLNYSMNGARAAQKKIEREQPGLPL